MADFPLTFTRLRFECLAETPLRFGEYRAGSNLRGALVNVMRRATCPLSVPALPGGVAATPDPQHVATCPVCWLVAANEKPGVERRGYILTPPLGPVPSYAPGERFAFHLTLVGEAQRFLPYFVLAVPEAGRMGMGAGRGRFALRRILAERLDGSEDVLLEEGETVLRPDVSVQSHRDVLARVDRLLPRDAAGGVLELLLHFLTPLRLIWNERLVKSPDFAVLFARLLERVDELAVQFAGGGRRPAQEVERLQNCALQVRLIEQNTRWVEVASGSSRTQTQTWLSGMVGTARYAAPLAVWRELLPWLVWGEVVQVGKDTVKGNGVVHIWMEGGVCGDYSASDRR